MDIVEKINRYGPVSVQPDADGIDLWEKGATLWKYSQPGILKIIETQAARTEGALRVGFDYSVGVPDVIILNLPKTPGRFLDTLESETGMNLFETGRDVRLVACHGKNLDPVASFDGGNMNKQFEAWLAERVDAAMGFAPNEPSRKAPEQKPGDAKP